MTGRHRLLPGFWLLHGLCELCGALMLGGDDIRALHEKPLAAFAHPDGGKADGELRVAADGEGQIEEDGGEVAVLDEADVLDCPDARGAGPELLIRGHG